jgi:hypothetical protein
VEVLMIDGGDDEVSWLYEFATCTLKNCVYLKDTKSILYEVETAVAKNTDNIVGVRGPACDFKSALNV